MASGVVLLPPGAAIRGDGPVAGPNAPPAGPKLQKGTEADPKHFFETLDFSATVNNYMDFPFSVPPDFDASGGISVSLRWFTAATTGNVVWAAAVGAYVSGTTNVFSHGVAAASTTTTAVPASTNVIQTTSIGISNIDSLTNVDVVIIKIYRDAVNAADTVNSNVVSYMFGRAIYTRLAA